MAECRSVVSCEVLSGENALIAPRLSSLCIDLSGVVEDHDIPLLRSVYNEGGFAIPDSCTLVNLVSHDSQSSQ